MVAQFGLELDDCTRNHILIMASMGQHPRPDFKCRHPTVFVAVKFTKYTLDVSVKSQLDSSLFKLSDVL